MKAVLNKPVILLLINCLLLGVGLFASLEIFFDTLLFPHKAFLVTSALLFAAFFVAFFQIKPGKKRRLLLLGLFLLWLAAGYFLWERLYSGALTASGYITPDLSRALRYEFPQPPVPDYVDEWNCAIFSLYVLIPYIALFVWAVLVHGRWFLSVSLTVPFFAFAYILKRLPQTWLLFLLLFFWMTTIIRSGYGWKKKNSGTAVSLTAMVLCGVFLIGLFGFAVPREGYQTPASIYELRSDLKQAAADIENGDFLDKLPGATYGSLLSDSDGTVNLGATGSIRFADRNVMRVYSEIPQNLYLRAYSASVYTGSRWLQKEDAPEETGLDVASLAYMDIVSDLYFEEEPALVTVEPDNPNSIFLFTPYLLGGNRSYGSAGRWMNDAYLEGHSEEKYSFYSYSGLGVNTVIMGNEAIGLRKYIYEHSQNKVEGILEYDGHMLSYYSGLFGPVILDEGVPEQILEGSYRMINDPVPELDTISMFYPPEYQDADYLRYIMEEYTELPEGLRESLIGWWRENHVGEDEVDWSTYFSYAVYWYGYAPELVEHSPFWNWVASAKEIAEELRTLGEYTTEPGVQPRNRDFVEYFLETSRQGYCVHYASAAVAMLRAFGIPARYAEGYVVREESFGSDGWATVPAKNAHAWAEIWVPNFGWIPVDATPSAAAALGGSSEVVEGEIAGQEDELTSLPEEDVPTMPEPAEEPAFQEPDISETAEDDASGAVSGMSGEGPEDDRSKSQFIAVLGSILAGLLLLSGGIFGLRRTARKRREKRFQSPDPNRAALYMYTFLDSLAAYGIVISEKGRGLALKARFSAHRLNVKELGEMRGEVAEAIVKLREQSSKLRKLLLWLRGIL